MGIESAEKMIMRSEVAAALELVEQYHETNGQLEKAVVVRSCRRVVETIAGLTLGGVMSLPDIAEMRNVLMASLTFAEEVAKAIDLDLEETSLNVRVMPEGNEIASGSWADVIRQGHEVLRKLGGAA